MPSSPSNSTDGLPAWSCHGPTSGSPIRRRSRASGVLNFYRIDRPRDGSKAEFSCWSPTLETPANFHLPARFGLLHILG